MTEVEVSGDKLRPELPPITLVNKNTRIPLHMLSIIYAHPQVAVLRGDKHEVSSLALSPDQTTLAAGYEDGCVRLWSVASCDSHITFR